MKKYFLLASIILGITICKGQNNTIFFGGNGDGISNSNYTQAYTNVTTGGTGDGSNANNYAQSYTDVRTGGAGDGSNANNYLQSYTDVRTGGVGDGSNANNYVQSYTDVRTGGMGDGWTAQLVVLPLTPLGISFFSFTGEQSNDIHVLNWKTIDESNTDYFVLEHSTDNLNFTTLVTIAAKGNTSGEWNYKYNNTAPKIGNNFYRIKLNDKNGSSTYSNIVLLKYAKDKSLINVYPNPAATQLNIEVQSATKKFAIQIEVMDISGKIIFHQLLADLQTSTSIDVSLWASGMYVVRIKEGNEATIIKVKKE